jgi:hypothetical protein
LKVRFYDTRFKDKKQIGRGCGAQVMEGDPAKILPKVYQAEFLYEWEMCPVV